MVRDDASSGWSAGDPAAAAAGSVKDAVGDAADKVKDVVNPKDDWLEFLSGLFRLAVGAP
jgi:hypothetical protein